MSSMYDEKVDTIYCPISEMWGKMWHNLQTFVKGGKILLDGSNIPECFMPIVQCGLKPDFDAPIANVPTELQANCDLSQFKLILADCRTGKAGQVIPLNVPKKGYVIHDNRRAFDCMVKSAVTVLGESGFEIVTAGMVGSYSQFMLSLAIKDESAFNVGKLANGANDKHHVFFNLNTSHDGSISSNRALSVIRQVCWNTINASIADATERGTIANIKHTANSLDMMKPEIFAQDLKNWLARKDEFKARLIACKNASMTADEFKAFASGVFTNAKTDMLSTVSFNRIENMTGLFQRGQGNVGKSRFDAVNAFTEFFTHGDSDSSVTTAKRVAMANFGRGNDWKNEALAVATDDELFQATVKRGTTLYADKLAATSAGN